MPKGCLQIVVIFSLVLAFEGLASPAVAGYAKAGIALPQQVSFQYPSYIVDAYDADGSCWIGADESGQWPVPVVPQSLLVGPPPSDVSCVTFPIDHWVELSFPGRLIDGPGDDIIILEPGPSGEHALVFATDGAGQEYLLDLIKTPDGGEQEVTVIGLDIAGISFPFVPCAIRILALDSNGALPGFDIASVRARTCVDCSRTACNPYPPNGAENVPPDAHLTWSPGNSAQKHTVYFGTAINAVDANAAPVGKPIQPQDANSYDPGGLELGENYYWRIDEVNHADANSPWTGDIWNFKVADRIVVDDFESYNYSSNKIYDTWKSTGQAYADISTSPVRSCGQSMAFGFYYDSYFYSELTRTFIYPQDWACCGIKVLELFFFGQATNHIDDLMMYIAIGDGDVNAVVLYDGDPNNVAKESWHLWRIDLRNVTGVNLGNVTNITIGMRLGTTQPGGYGAGRIYFDDIVLYPSRCLQENKPVADWTGDCVVDLEDLEELSYNWLDSRYTVHPISPPKDPIAWYKFDGNTQDSIGSAHGDPSGSPTFVPGIYGQAISFNGYGDFVAITRAAELFSRINTQITIAFWQYGSDSPHLTDTVCCSNYIYGSAGPAIAINLGCWRNPSKYNWDCGFPWSFNGRLSGEHRYKSEWQGRWNHWAFTKNCQAGSMQIFLNGRLYDSRAGAKSPILGIDSFIIGSGWYGGYDGLIDDFRIYDYALSQLEVAYIATNGTGIFDQPLMSPADVFTDEQINFKDFAIFADNWLAEHLWP